MADSSSEPSDNSESLCVKHISGSPFSIPNFFVGFGAKGSSESDPDKSPTSPLELGIFTNFSSLFSARSLVWSSPKNGHRNRWDRNKVGLSIVNLLPTETELNSEDPDDPTKKEKNLVLASQVKIKIPKYSGLDPSLESNSLPKDYISPPLSHTISHCPELIDSNGVLNLKDEGIMQEPSSSVKPSSSPMNIVSGHVYSRSLSAREMTLSEDYTCIISHGPNPKTTHIFGDCILDCDPNELANFDAEEEAKSPEEDSLLNNSSDDFSCFCSSCKKKQQEGDDIYIQRCVCSSDGILAKEEIENTCDNSLEITPGSSYHEDIFPMGMPLIP